MSARGLGQPKDVFIVASVYKFSDDATRELIDHIHRELNSLSAFNVAYVEKHHWFSVQCHSRDRPVVEKSVCAVSKDFEKRYTSHLTTFSQIVSSHKTSIRYHVENQSDLVGLFKLIDQPDRLLIRTLVLFDNDKDLLLLPIHCTWASCHRADGGFCADSVLGPAVATPAYNIWDYAAHLKQPFPSMSDCHPIHASRSEDQTRLNDWVPSLYQTFEDVEPSTAVRSDKPASIVVQTRHQRDDSDDELSSICEEDDLITFDRLTNGPSVPTENPQSSAPRLVIEPSLPDTTERTSAPTRSLPSASKILNPISNNITRPGCTGNTQGIFEGLEAERPIDLMDFKRTMRQQTGRDTAVILESGSRGRSQLASASNVKDQQGKNESLFEPVSLALNDARFFPGTVNVVVAIGKALYKRPLTQSFVGANVLEENLNNGSVEGPFHFTQMVTQSMRDTNRVLSMEGSAGQTMFKAIPFRTESSFVLCFSNHDAVVELNGEVTQRQITSDIISMTYLLYPQHVWDARFQVIGQTVLDKVSPELQPSIDSIRKGGPDNNPLLSWSPNPHGHVSQIQHKRVLDFEACHPDWILRVTEVSQYELTETEDGTCCAQAGLWDTITSDGRLWYEFSLCLRAQSIPAFNQNKSLHVGETAQYTEPIMTKKQVATMRQLINDLVTRMDGIGLANRGPRGDDEDLASIEAKKRDAVKRKLRATEQPIWELQTKGTRGR